MHELTGRQLVRSSLSLVFLGFFGGPSFGSSSGGFSGKLFFFSFLLLLLPVLLHLFLQLIFFILLLLRLGIKRRPCLILVAPSKSGLGTVFFEPVLELLLAVELLVVGEDAEVVSKEAANDNGKIETEDDLLLDGNSDVSDTIVASGDLIVIIQEVEVDCVPGGEQANGNDRQNGSRLQGDTGAVSVLSEPVDGQAPADDQRDCEGDTN